MVKKIKLDKEKLLKQLQPIKYDKNNEEESTFFEKTSLAGALLALTKIDQEHEYMLCKTIAESLLEKVPEPEEIDLEEE